MENDLQPGLKFLEYARSYSEAAKQLTTKPKKRRKCEHTHLNQSAAIYAGLAIDFYLKTLYSLEHKHEYNEQGKTPHDFHALYKTLKNKTQKELETQFTTILSKQELETSTENRIFRDLKELLKIWTNAFMHLRVNPLKFTEKDMVFFHEMEEAFKGQILKEKPEWAYQTTRKENNTQSMAAE